MEVVVRSDEAAWSDALSHEWSCRLAATPAARLCLATGDTPTPLYGRMTGGFAAAQIFLLDEYLGLEPDHPGRCRTMLERDLMAHVDTNDFDAPDVDHRDPDQAATEYGERISAGGIDLAILGLGGNGHLGMNEPGSDPSSTTRVVALASSTQAAARRYGIAEPPEYGITVGLQELLVAREVWLLVRGAHKAQVLARVIHGPVTTDCPASLLRSHPNATVWADDAAAVNLRARK